MQQVTQLKHNGEDTNLLAVVVPKDASDFNLLPLDNEYTQLIYQTDSDNAPSPLFDIRQYEILGLITKDSVGFDANKLGYCLSIKGEFLPASLGHTRDIFEHRVRSLLAANGLVWENAIPMPKQKETLIGVWVWDMDRYFKELTAWQSAQSNLLGEQNILIIKKL